MELMINIKFALAEAKYKRLDDKSFYGSIPGFKGVWANAWTKKECRQCLHEVLEDWITLKIKSRDKLPLMHGKSLELPSWARA